jgi:hypothetical protein
MKRGTFIINPYVNPYYSKHDGVRFGLGKPNPNYKTMFWKRCGETAECIDFNGEIVYYFYEDVITWETDGCADLSKTYLRGLFGIKDNKWLNIKSVNNDI